MEKGLTDDQIAVGPGPEALARLYRGEEESALDQGEATWDDLEETMRDLEQIGPREWEASLRIQEACMGPGRL